MSHISEDSCTAKSCVLHGFVADFAARKCGKIAVQHTAATISDV
jgi:hypothetical protein